MRALPLLLLLCVLSVAPAYGQPVTPTPPNATTFITEVAETTQALGILTVVVLVVLGVLAVIVLIVLAVAWKGLSPLLSTIKTLNDARDDLQEQLFNRLEKGDIERATTAAINRETVNALKERETKTEAQTRSDAAVGQINEHTDIAQRETQRLMAEFEGRLNKALEQLGEATRSIDNRLGAVDDTIRIKLEDVRGELNAIKHSVEQAKIDTDKLDPSKVPDIDPAEAARHADIAPKPPSVWDGDHPPNV